MSNQKTIREYAIQVKPLSDENGGGFEALFPQLVRSLVGYGETQQEAIEDLLGAVPALLQVMDENQQKLPAPEGPREWDEFSGKFNVRVPKMLHAKLVRLAEEQDVSLNSLVQTLLMSGATALDAGHEFGAVIPSRPEPAAETPYRWNQASVGSAPTLRLEEYDNLPRERNPDIWKTAVGD